MDSFKIKSKYIKGKLRWKNKKGRGGDLWQRAIKRVKKTIYLKSNVKLSLPHILCDIWQTDGLTWLVKSLCSFSQVYFVLG